MNIKEIITDVIFALILSVLYVSAIFISHIIDYNSGFLSFVYIEFTAILYGVSLISRNKKIWLLKWGLSIPFSYFVIQYFWNADYSIRALNWVFPNYGEDTAGGMFTGFVLLLLLSISCLIFGIIGLFIKIDNFTKFEKIQFIGASVFTGLTVATVLILEHQFPTYEYIISHL